MTRSNRWLLAIFGAFTIVLGLSFALVQPPYGLSDEPAHAIKALATADGQLSGPKTVGQFGYSAVEFEVPLAYTSIWHFTCYSGDVNQTPECAPPFPSDQNRTISTSTAGEYPPPYYAIVGGWGWISPGETGLFLMRIFTVLICSLFLTMSGYLFVVSGNSARLVALLVCATPTVFSFSGAVNPFSPEITASILYWTSGIFLLKSEMDKRRVVIPFFYIGAVSFGVIRPASFLWILISMSVIVLATVNIQSLKSSSKRKRDFIHFLIANFVAISLSTSWYLFGMSTRSLGAGSPAGGEFMDNVLISARRTPAYLRQIFGFFGWTTFYAPLVVLLFFLLAVFLLYLVNHKHSLREVIALTSLFLFLFLGPAILEGARAANSGWGFQGRYLMPVAVGIPILLTLTGGHRSINSKLLVAASLLIVSGHVIALSFVTKRFTEGLDGPFFWPTQIDWSGLGGPIAIQVTFLMALLLGAGFVFTQYLVVSQEKTVSTMGVELHERSN